MELLILTAICGLVGLGCIGGALWAIVGGEDIGVERIFLVMVWLLFAALFLGLAAWVARQGPLRSLGKKSPPQPEQKEEEVGKSA